MPYQFHQQLAADPLTTHGVLWVVAIATFGGGDIATTAIFLITELNHEGNPIVIAVIEQFGLWVLLPWKIIVFAVFVAGYRLAPTRINVGIPLGLALFGTLLTAWNIYSSLTGARIVF